MTFSPSHFTTRLTTVAALENDEMFIGTGDKPFEILTISEPFDKGDDEVRTITAREIGGVKEITADAPTGLHIARIHNVL